MSTVRTALVLCLVCASTAVAHERQPDGGVEVEETTVEPLPVAQPDGGVDAHPAMGEPLSVEAPVLTSQVEPVYPPQALLDRREGHVHLELLIDEHGHVQEAKLLESGGPDFDASVLDAVKRYVFTPAHQNGQPARALVRYTHIFHLPNVALLPSVPDAGIPEQQSPDYTTVVLAQRPISAASSFTVRDRDFDLRPIGSVQDILRVTPGLVMVQHSGGGKANQYFLRGFDADHGTDIALSIDGIPINMVSHAHGQGFSDTNFIIPEVVERVQVTKGPYFANQGDFDTAGGVNLVSRDNFKQSSFALGFGGSPGYGAPSERGLLIVSPKLGEDIKATFAAEIGRANGPFDNPENWNKYKLFNKVTFNFSPRSQLSLTEMSYGGTWNGSGQIPQRAVSQGLVSRFGSIDPDEGGGSTRHQLSLAYSLRPDDRSELKFMAYVASYTFNLFSNFTLYLNDPENGDEIEQIDRRVFYGGKASYRVVHNAGPVRFDTTVGADLRMDDIHGELWHTADRIQLNNERNNDVHEMLGGLYLNEEVTPIKWLRIDVGGRADLMSFSVDNKLAVFDPTAPRSGVSGAAQLSPKTSLVATALDMKNANLEFYANYGHGFHSNDVRGAFSTPAVSPLTRAIGEELGVRTRLFNRFDFAAAFWKLDLANETVWNGDDGTTAVNGPTDRYGVELETRYEFNSWLAADADVTFTHSQFTGDHENGGGLALAPKQTWSGGLSARHQLGPGIARAGLRFYGIGNRPANDDGSLIAPGWTQVDLHMGYRHRWFDISLDIENLLNGNYRSAQFATVSRLRTEPTIGSNIPQGFSCGANARLASGASAGKFYGCEDVDYTPAYPFTVRLTATVFFD